MLGRFCKAAACLSAVLYVLVYASCGSVDLGETGLPRMSTLPDPEVFGRSLHAELARADGCAAAGCHGREGASFRLHPADPLGAGFEAAHPLELPEPQRSDYYTVLAFSDLAAPLSSRLLVWGEGADGAHPGGEALTMDLRQAVVDWLSGEVP
ncbi:MAG: hypothetical protein JXR96_11660 [Deltaproteobacteria bacterium]|nr:hypothetical protein [Deltaproteobacteria bacterium]